MAIITIQACERTPNYDALEAVAKHIMRNKNNVALDRPYVMQQEIKVSSGLIIDVREHDFTEQENQVDAFFSLVMVDRAKGWDKPVAL